MTDEELTGKVAEIVAELRRAQEELSALSHDLLGYRERLHVIGTRAARLHIHEKRAPLRERPHRPVADARAGSRRAAQGCSIA